MKRRNTIGAATAVLVALLALSLSSSAATPPGSIHVTSVGGHAVNGSSVGATLSGTVTVSGHGSLSGGSRAVQPLVADAGASPFVRAGDAAMLQGSAWGGTAPYTYSWSGSAGTIKGPKSAVAQVQTKGVAAGTHSYTLTVRDADGRTSRDVVKAVVYAASPAVLLNHSQDTTPGTFATDEPVSIPFTVPAGVASMTAKLSWTVDANDFDISLKDPNGADVTIQNGGPPQTSESIDVQSPKAGTWTFVTQAYLTAVDTITAHVDAARTANDPRPRVDTAGPFTFLTGAAQKLGASIHGGTGPFKVTWDVDEDGRADATGLNPKVAVPPGRHLATVRVRDARGLEARQTTSILVGNAAALKAATPITVIGLADTGINPYHEEFSATTYPDPDVLALTRNFTRDPADYIPGFPKSAKALPISLGNGYYPAQDKQLWQSVQGNSWYWIPGTKIIGAYSAGVTGSNVSADVTPILDDDGHGTGSASVAAGNRYGYCPTCLLVVVEALDESIVSSLPWVDIQSNSFGYTGGAPVGPVVGPNAPTKKAVERGQTVLFAAGNGVGNAFDVPVATYGSDQTGNDWNITVGAIRRDNQRAIVGDGIPVHLSSWGDGNIPSACRTGTVSQCQHGGTSAATPYTAGVFGTVLNTIRGAIGDGDAGQKAHEVVAQGARIAGSRYLSDGKLTRAELREAVLKTAFPLNQDNNPSIYPFPVTAPYSGDTNVLVEGYGAATPESAKRAIDVLLGRTALPERSFEDQFFAVDRQIRDTLYGGYDRDGDGTNDSYAVNPSLLSGLNLNKVNGTLKALRKLAIKDYALGSVAKRKLGANRLTYFLHRSWSASPDAPTTCGAEVNEKSMDTRDSSGDLEPCYESRVTIAAAFRPVGVFASAERLDAPLPAGSHVAVTIYLAAENPTVIRPTGVLMATDREIGRGDGQAQPVLGSGTGPGSDANGNELPNSGACKALGELRRTKFQLAFDTARPAFAGETLIFQVSLVGTRAWAFGFEGQHASQLTIDAAPVPATGFDFGVTVDTPAAAPKTTEGPRITAGGRVSFPDQGSDPTGAGDHPSVKRVQVSLDDPHFRTPENAAIDAASGTWSADLGKLHDGRHTLYARAVQDGRFSDVSVRPFVAGDAPKVQWQIVTPGAAAKPGKWQTATGWSSWSFRFNAANYGHGTRVLLVRLVDGQAELARESVVIHLR